QASVVGSVAVSGHFVYRDRAALGDTPAAAPPRYLYAVQVVEGHGQRTALSTVQEILLAPPPAAPVRLKVENAEREVRLAWESGAPDAKGELFNVYRRPAAETEEPLVPLNAAPLS